jgi:uncharacterized sulfatase
MSRRPNFVIVMTDTQDTRLVGAYGNPAMRTPCLDNLASSGMTFERAYCVSPVCTPARAAIFTGMYPHIAGAFTNLVGLYAETRTMGQRFQEAGYDTAYTGKWHLDGHDYFGTGICPPGWDPEFWYDGRNHLESLSPDERKLWRTGLGSYEALKKHVIGASFTWAHRAADRALAFLKKPRKSPFLLVVSYDEPHHPSTCPPEFVEPFLKYGLPVGPSWSEDLSGKPAHQREWAASAGTPAPGGKAVRPLYFGCNSFVDSEIGRVVDAARATGEDTWIIYTSDHGDMLGAHRLSNKGPAMYDGITRIPFIVQGPGVPAGARERSVVGHADILPTMMELAGLPIPPVITGCSARSLLAGGGFEPGRQAFAEYTRYEADHERFGEYQPIRCLIRWPWKLVLNLHATDELYDMEHDPHEMENLIDSPAHAPERDRMHDALLDEMSRSRDPWRGSYWEKRSWREKPGSDWIGGTRFNPADGHRPGYLDYDTGEPPKEGFKARPG